MAKFCLNCGAALDDAATICPSCGMVYEEESKAKKFPKFDVKGKIDVVINSIKSIDDEKKNKFIKFGAFGAAAIVGIVVIILVVSLIFNGVGYKGLVKDFITSLKKSDGELYVDLLSDYVLYERPEELADMYELDFDADDVRDDLVDIHEEVFIDELDEFFTDKTGRNYKLSYKIVEADELKNREYKALYKEYDIPGDEDDDPELAAEEYWEKAMLIELELTAKGKEGKKTVDITLIIAKEENGWKIVNCECNKPEYSSVAYEPSKDIEKYFGWVID